MRRGRRRPIRALAAGAVLVAALGTAGATGAATPTAPTPARAAPTPRPPTLRRLAVRAAALIEESTGRQLYGARATAELPVASTTKLMTALITLTHARLDDVFSDPPFSFPAEDSQIHLRPGERMSVRDLLLAMLLPSADDAAEDLAYNIGHGSVTRFEALMNARAQALGLRHTHYATPVGLDTPGNYSSAGDLVSLARYLLLNQPFFSAVVRLPSAVLRTGSYVRYVVNRNDLVGRYAWINGVKTGHTDNAHYVLVVSGTRDGMTLIGAVIGASSMAACDAAALRTLDYGFAAFRLRTPVRAGQVIARVAVRGAGSKRRRVGLIASRTYSHVFPIGTRLRLRVTAPPELAGPLPRHSRVGTVLVLAGDTIVARIPLLLARRLPRFAPQLPRAAPRLPRAAPQLPRVAPQSGS